MVMKKLPGAGYWRLKGRSEEQFLWRDMQNDMVQQIMRRLAASTKPVPKVP